MSSRIQITTDGHRVYAEAVEGAFGMDVDYAMLIKLYESMLRPIRATAQPSVLAFAPLSTLAGTRIGIISLLATQSVESSI